MPTLPTTVRAPEGAAPAGNWEPGHTHIARDLTVAYPHVGDRAALLLPCYRYRILETGGCWMLEASPDGASWWERHGEVVAAGWPLAAGTTYVITHQPGAPCEMAIVELAAGCGAGTVADAA